MFFQNRLAIFSPFQSLWIFWALLKWRNHATWFWTKTTLNLSPRPKLHPNSMIAWSNPLASFDPFRLHHIVGFIKSLCNLGANRVILTVVAWNILWVTLPLIQKQFTITVIQN